MLGSFDIVPLDSVSIVMVTITYVIDMSTPNHAEVKNGARLEGVDLCRSAHLTFTVLGPGEVSCPSPGDNQRKQQLKNWRNPDGRSTTWQRINPRISPELALLKNHVSSVAAR